MIKIIIAGKVASGKTSVAEILRTRLQELGLEVNVKDSFDEPHTEVLSEKILKNLKPRVEIETVQLNHEGQFPSPEIGYPRERQKLSID